VSVDHDPTIWSLVDQVAERRVRSLGGSVVAADDTTRTFPFRAGRLTPASRSLFALGSVSRSDAVIALAAGSVQGIARTHAALRHLT
jgi:hypothetical protein